jgi:hypothetical protein
MVKGMISGITNTPPYSSNNLSYCPISRFLESISNPIVSVFQTGLLENLQRLEAIFVEEVAKIGRHDAIKCFT